MKKFSYFPEVITHRQYECPVCEEDYPTADDANKCVKSHPRIDEVVGFDNWCTANNAPDSLFVKDKTGRVLHYHFTEVVAENEEEKQMKTIEESLGELAQVYGIDAFTNACRNIATNNPIVPVVHEIKIDSVVLLEAFKLFKSAGGDIYEASVNYQTALNAEKRLPTIPTQYERLLNPSMLMETFDQLDGSVTDNMNRTDVYGEKGPLLRKKAMLENAIKLTEATAIMRPEFLPLKNDTLRDAYRREASKVDRTQLAEVDGQIFEIDVAVAKERDAQQSLVVATESVQRKAALQTAILNFLAGGRV